MRIWKIFHLKKNLLNVVTISFSIYASGQNLKGNVWRKGALRIVGLQMLFNIFFIAHCNVAYVAKQTLFK